MQKFFRRLKPLLYAIEPYNKQIEYFDVYILSTAQWSNQDALVEKMNVVRGLEGPQHPKNIVVFYIKISLNR